MNWSSIVIGGSGTIGSFILATQAATGTLDLPTTLGALGALVTAFAVAAVKIWSVMRDVLTRLQQIADEAQERRKAAEAESAALRQEVARLSAEIEALREQLEERQDEHETTVQGLEDSIEDLETRLIVAVRERDQYRELYHQATEVGKEEKSEKSEKS